METIRDQQDQYKDSQSGLCSILPAAAVVNNRLHIIFYDRKRNNADSRYNKLLVVDPDTFEITKIYELGNGGFYTCISPSLTSRNGFVVYNAVKASVELYDLD